MLAGYKTYILAAVSALGAIAGWLVGDLSVAEAAQLVVTAGLGATIGHKVERKAR